MKSIRYIVTIAYALMIFYLSSRTWSGGPEIPYLDKLAHIILYFGFGGFMLWALRITRLREKPYITYLAFLLTFSYGLSDEIHQLFVPGREFSVIDLYADGIGAALGIFVATKLVLLKQIAKSHKKDVNYENEV
ncbi:MAG: VanZ family protein [Pseudomonadota bacterium]